MWEDLLCHAEESGLHPVGDRESLKDFEQKYGTISFVVKIFLVVSQYPALRDGLKGIAKQTGAGRSVQTVQVRGKWQGAGEERWWGLASVSKGH